MSADSVKSVAIHIPVYDKGSLTAFRLKFDGYCALLKLDDADKLRILPLCFEGKRYNGIWETFDGRTTIESAFEKIKEFVHQEERPSDPLQHFMDRSWQTHESGFEFIRELRHRANFITKSKQEVDDLIKLQVVRCLPDCLRPVAAEIKEVDALASFLVSVNRPTENLTAAVSKEYYSRSTMVCYNCGKQGHTSRRCRSRRSTCSLCEKIGHLDKFCRGSKEKNLVSGSSQ